MSVQALTWVLDYSEAEGADRLVLISLCNHAHKDGTHAFPTVSTIRKESRLRSRRTVQMTLRQLQQAGAIEATGVGPNGAIEYRVDMGDAGLAYRSPRVDRKRKGGATDAPPQGGALGTPEGAHSAHEGGATGSRAGRTVPNRPVNPPSPPKGEKPDSPLGDRKRDHASYRVALRRWAPCPGAVPVEGWAEIRDHIAWSVDDAVWHGWLAQVHPHALDADGELVLAAPTRSAAYADGRYGRLLAACAASVWPDVVRVTVIPCDSTRVACLSPDHPSHEGATCP